MASAPAHPFFPGDAALREFDPWSLWLAGPGIAVASARYVSYFLPTRRQQTQRRVPPFGEMRCFVLHFATVSSISSKGKGK
jgi:hypothetical protein